MQAHSQMRRFAAAARHGHCKQPAVQHGLFDLADDLQVVGRPCQVKRERENTPRRKTESSFSALAFRSGLTTSGSSPMSRPASDMAALRARARSFKRLVGIAVGFGLRRMPDR